MKTVKASTLLKGDTILIFSARRREPMKAKIKTAYFSPSDVTFVTTRGNLTFGLSDSVEVPESKDS